MLTLSAPPAPPCLDGGEGCWGDFKAVRIGRLVGEVLRLAGDIRCMPAADNSPLSPRWSLGGERRRFAGDLPGDTRALACTEDWCCRCGDPRCKFFRLRVQSPVEAPVLPSPHASLPRSCSGALVLDPSRPADSPDEDPTDEGPCAEDAKEGSGGGATARGVIASVVVAYEEAVVA
jgi:hypothetical protein